MFEECTDSDLELIDEYVHGPGFFEAVAELQPGTSFGSPSTEFHADLALSPAERQGHLDLPPAEPPADLTRNPVEAEPHAPQKEFNPNFLYTADFENFPGPFNFEVSVADCSDQKRRKPHVYSAVLKTLYSVDGEPVAFVIKVSPKIPPNCVMYVFPMFIDLVFRPENVVACPFHRDAKHPENQACERKVFLRAGTGVQVNYMTVGSPARDVLQFSLPNPENQVIPLRFMCRNSCQGGINRRATKLILALCNSNNDVLGVATIDFKIVKVPSRDCASAERKSRALSPPAPLKRTAKSKIKSKSRPRSEAEAGSSDSDEYVVQVRGFRNYVVLKASAEALELRRQEMKNMRKKPKIQESQELKS